MLFDDIGVLILGEDDNFLLGFIGDDAAQSEQGHEDLELVESHFLMI